MVNIKNCTRNVVIYFQHKDVIIFEGLITPKNNIAFNKLPQKYKKKEFYNDIGSILQTDLSFDTWFFSNYYTNIADKLNIYRNIRDILDKIYKGYSNLYYYESLSLEDQSNYYTDFNNRLIGDDFIFYSNDEESNEYIIKRVKKGLDNYDKSSFTPEKNYCHEELIPILYFLKYAKSNLIYEIASTNYYDDPEIAEFERMEREKESNPFSWSSSDQAAFDSIFRY